MSKKVRWITETAVMLALLVALQALTKPFGQLVTVPAIMVGNTVFVVLLHFIAGKSSGIGQRIAAWLVAAVAKFAALYLLVVKIICGLAAAPLLANGTLKEPMLKALPIMFAWPQLITALIGGGIALLIIPVLRKALHK